MEKRICISPNETTSDGNSEGFVQALKTHSWEVQNHQKLLGLGLIVRFKCTKCNLEWSNIVVEEEERSSHLQREEEEDTKSKKPVFEY